MVCVFLVSTYACRASSSTITVLWMHCVRDTSYPRRFQHEANQLVGLPGRGRQRRHVRGCRIRGLRRASIQHSRLLPVFVCKAPREGIDVSRQAVDHVCAWGSNPKEGGDGARFLRHRARRVACAGRS